MTYKLPTYFMFRLVMRIFLFSALLMLSVIGQSIFTEGSFQTGLFQLSDREPFASGYAQYIDVIPVGKVINVSVYGENNNDNVQISTSDLNGIKFKNTTSNSECRYVLSENNPRVDSPKSSYSVSSTWNSVTSKSSRLSHV